MVVSTASWFIQCSQEVKTEDNLVIQAYLFSNEPVRNIKVMQTLPIESTDTLAPPITDATVIIKKAGKEYPLQFNSASGAYFYPGNGLVV